jgi:hypothetical protein
MVMDNLKLLQNIRGKVWNVCCALELNLGSSKKDARVVTKTINRRFSIGLNGKFLRFRRDGVSISYTVICLSHFDVCLAIT